MRLDEEEALKGKLGAWRSYPVLKTCVGLLKVECTRRARAGAQSQARSIVKGTTDGIPELYFVLPTWPILILVFVWLQEMQRC